MHTQKGLENLKEKNNFNLLLSDTLVLCAHIIDFLTTDLQTVDYYSSNHY